MDKTKDIQKDLELYRASNISRDLEQYRAQNASVITEKRKKTVGEKLSNIGGVLFGGKTIGEAIGTVAAREKTRQGNDIITTDYEKLNPEARMRLEAKGVPTSRESQLKETAKRIKGPKGGQVAGDVIASGLGILGLKGAPLALKGASTAAKATRIGSNIALGAGIGGARALETGENVGKGALTGGVITAALPVVGKAVSKTAKLTGRLGKSLASALSGKKLQVIDEIIENPREALVGVKAGEALLPENATQIRKTIAAKARQASDEFAKALDDLPKTLGRPTAGKPGKISTISVDGAKKKLSTLGVKQKLTKTLRDFGVEVNTKKLDFDFLQSPFDKAEANRLKEVFEVVRQWKDTSPKGLHMLSRKIKNFRKVGEQSPELNAVIDSMSRSVRDYLGERVPALKQMLSKYAQTQDIIDAFDQEFSTSGKFVGGTGERIKTGKKLAGVFSGEKTEAQNLLRKEVPGLLQQEAGRQLITAEPGAQSVGVSIGELLRTLTSSVITPKTIATVLVQVGFAQKAAQSLAPTLAKLEPALRIELIRALSGSLGGSQTKESQL